MEIKPITANIVPYGSDIPTLPASLNCTAAAFGYSVLFLIESLVR